MTNKRIYQTKNNCRNLNLIIIGILKTQIIVKLKIILIMRSSHIQQKERVNKMMKMINKRKIIKVD